LTEKDRFYYLQNDDPIAYSSKEYKPVKIVGSYPLDKLPEKLNENKLKIN